MNKLLNSLGARVLAFVLLLAFITAFAFSFVAVVVLCANEAYRLDGSGMSGEVFWSWCYNETENALAKFAIEKTTAAIVSDSAYACVITDKDGNEVYNTLNDREYMLQIYPQTLDFVEEHDYSENSDYAAEESGVIVYHGESGYGYTWAWRTPDSESADAAVSGDTDSSDGGIAVGNKSDNEADSATSDKEAHGKDNAESASAADENAPTEAVYDASRAPYSVQGYILAQIPQDSELYITGRVVQLIYGWRYQLLAAAVGTGLASIALFVFLMAAAGRRAGTGEVTPTWVERIPFDLYSAIMLLLGSGCMGAMVVVIEEWQMDMALGALLVVAGVALAAVLILWCMSLSLRIKLKTVFTSCVCYRVLAWCWRIVKKLWHWVKRLLGALLADIKTVPFVPRAVLIVLVVLAAEFMYILSAANDTAGQLFGWFVERALLLLAGVYVLAAAKRLLEGGRAIASGNMSHRVDTSRMRGALAEHGENLNRITDGMNKALAERVKSERFKTELITNVSHDIKTPLTSIVNYVDLLEKEEIDNPKAKEYLAVLSRQSARLKKLIEDLMEASKASTGNLTVKPERCELGVMLAQTAGEYEEKLAAAGLELVVDKPEENVYIMADRQQLWRVFDNLMNNACKYSLPGTRVYLEVMRVTRTGGEALCPGAVVTFRNISKTRLTVPGEELSERFVRGDSSRNTEGSGLGLSIANSLTELQNGKMTITVDGDLFKVQLSFDTVQ